MIQIAAAHLAKRGIENAKQEAVWLFEHVFGKIELTFSMEEQNPEQLNDIARIASLKNTKRYNELIMRRIGGEPLQYLLGEWEFYGYPMKVGAGVLIPRPETEFIIDIAKTYIQKTKPEMETFTVLDLCAGSGCVAIAMCKETRCKGIAVEVSTAAAEYARQNIDLNGLTNDITLHIADIFDEAFVREMPAVDCIFANPPYLSIEEMKKLQREVQFEPEMALYGGSDGLAYYRKIFKVWQTKLKPNGLFAVEVGDGQAKQVADEMRKAGFSPLLEKDYAKMDRIVYTAYTASTDTAENVSQT